MEGNSFVYFGSRKRITINAKSISRIEIQNSGIQKNARSNNARRKMASRRRSTPLNFFLPSLSHSLLPLIHHPSLLGHHLTLASPRRRLPRQPHNPLRRHQHLLPLRPSINFAPRHNNFLPRTSPLLRSPIPLI